MESSQLLPLTSDMGWLLSPARRSHLRYGTPITANHCIYYCGQESLRRNGVAIMVNKRVRNAILGCNLKNYRMISVRCQGKPFNITVIQVYALTRNAEESKVEWFCEDLQDLLE